MESISLDFFKPLAVKEKSGRWAIKPDFVARRPKDLMIRGGDFFAIYDPRTGFWSTDPYVAIDLMDQIVEQTAREYDSQQESATRMFLRNTSNHMIDTWKHFVKKQMTESWHQLDAKLVFANQEVTREDYVTKKMPYALEEGSTECWDKLIGTLYSKEERHKIEWAIGCIINGDSRKVQKFNVIYGEPGKGKSTILNIIAKIFEGHVGYFNAAALASKNDSFGTAAFKNDPLVAIQQDGDLSKIERNDILNSIIAHETVTINEKFVRTFDTEVHSWLLMGTNYPVKIANGESGLARRLIDVVPTGKTLPKDEYDDIMERIEFELGAIAYKCKKIYERNRKFYNSYIPQRMIQKTDYFYNFIMTNIAILEDEDPISLKRAWDLYKEYKSESNLEYALNRLQFDNVFSSYYEHRTTTSKGGVLYSNLRMDKIKFQKEELEDYHEPEPEMPKSAVENSWIQLKEQKSLLDEMLKDWPAQYSVPTDNGEKPEKAWDFVKTTLKDLDTKKLHYILPQEPTHIFMDFDLKDENGNKSLELNLAAASKFPKTYAETSKSGKGLHLHYIYTGGDPSELSALFDKDIEIKVFTGKSSMRRKLVLCNDIPVNTISTGLPKKEVKAPVLDFKGIRTEAVLRRQIVKALNKQIHTDTTSNVDYIAKILRDAYESKMPYDVSDLKGKVLTFAGRSTHQANKCLETVAKMQFASEIQLEGSDNYADDAIVFFDVEVFKNLFIICYKFAGSDIIYRLINPKPSVVAKLFEYRLVGFNNRDYDNHICYARMMGYSNYDLYLLSKQIIKGDKSKNNGKFPAAFNLSYTDIYDYAKKKQSLKKWEIDLDKHHQELKYDWDSEIPEELWDEVAGYCCNDVEATEAVWNHTQSDFRARQILVKLCQISGQKACENDKTNVLSEKFIFGSNTEPQNTFSYRDLSKPVKEISDEMREHLTGRMKLDDWDGPLGKSVLPYWPEYEFNQYPVEGKAKSIYHGENGDIDIGEGGAVLATPGMYGTVWTFDVTSMHPHTVMMEYLFGAYTKRFEQIVQARILIKHKDFATARLMLDGALSEFLDDPTMASELAEALKIVINSVYGETSAHFKNRFRDPRNIDNIVAKRGALFMIRLKSEVEKLGYTVVHIKTDSIKVENPDQRVYDFIMSYGKEYGYSFEIEHKFERFCLVNDAVYIAKLAADDPKDPGAWTATGTQFQIPFVFKTLFSKEAITFKDLCTTKSVKTSMYLDFNEGLGENEHSYQFVGKCGLFVPVKPGCGGGLLLRKADTADGSDKYGFATGCKGYRWLEAERVKLLHMEDAVDMDYWRKIVDKAVDTINEFGDINGFINGEYSSFVETEEAA